MKNLRLIIYIVVILALVCSPAIAISSSDLIAQYRGQSASTIPTVVPTTTPTTTPTTITTGDENIRAHLCAALLSVTTTPTRAMVIIDGSYEGLTPFGIRGLSVGTHQLKVSKFGYETYSTEVVIPEPSYHMTWYYGMEARVCDTPSQTIDVTLKKVESTQKPTIPTTFPTAIPTWTPTPIPTKLMPTSTPTPLIPSGFVTPIQTPTPSNDSNEPLHGVEYISVNSKPPGADVYLRHLFSDLPDEYLGITPILIREMPIKNPDYQGCEWVRITLTKTGYKNTTFDWPLCDGSTPTFFITLTPTQTTSGSTDEDRYSPWFRRPNNNFLVF